MSGSLGVPIAYCSVPRATSNYGKLEVYTIVTEHFCLQFNPDRLAQSVQVCDLDGESGHKPRSVQIFWHIMEWITV